MFVILRKDNKGLNYILTCIDVFSKMAFAEPIKNKTSVCVIPAFERIFKSSGLPLKIQSDKGKEFLNKNVQQFFKDKGIHHFTTENETTKAAICERFNRTLLNRLYRYFTFKKTRRYVEVLPKLVSAYNRSYHRSIKRRPIDVSSANQEEVWQTLYNAPNPKRNKTELKVGDRVRLSTTRRLFKKGYLPSWTGELFTVKQVLKTTPTTYTIIDDHDEELQGSFYSNELLKVGEKTVYEIEKVIRKRKNSKGRWELFVKWRDYPESFNSWILQSAVKTVKN